MWKECKQRIFNEVELLDQRLKEFFIKSLSEWSHASLEMESLSILDFLDALSLDNLACFVDYSCTCLLLLVM